MLHLLLAAAPAYQPLLIRPYSLALANPWNPLTLAHPWQGLLEPPPLFMRPPPLASIPFSAARAIEAHRDTIRQLFEQLSWREEGNAVVSAVSLGPGLKDGDIIAELDSSGTELTIRGTLANGGIVKSTFTAPFAVEAESVSIQYEPNSGKATVRLPKASALEPSHVPITPTGDFVKTVAILGGAKEVRAELKQGGQQLLLSGLRKSGAEFKGAVSLPFAVSQDALALEYSSESDVLTIKVPKEAARPSKPSPVAIVVEPAEEASASPSVAATSTIEELQPARNDEHSLRVLDEKYGFVHDKEAPEAASGANAQLADEASAADAVE